MKETKPKYKVPFIGSKLMELFLPLESKEFLLGDFESIFYEKFMQKGKLYAIGWYWLQILLNAPIFIFTSLLWGITMYKNYLKVTFRSLKRNKLFSFINIGGLALSLAAFSLILVFIIDEFSYDNFFENKDRVYRIEANIKSNDDWRPISLTPPAWEKIIQKDFPQVEATTMLTVKSLRKVSFGQKQFSESMYYASDGFFDVLSFPLLKGDKETALKEPYTMVITETLSKKFFGDEDPMGKTLRINDGSDFLITGLLKDLPDNSSMQFSFLISLSTYESNEEGRERLKEVTGCNFINFVKLEPSADPDNFEKQIKTHFRKYTDEPGIYDIDPYLQKIDEIYLYSEAAYQYNATGSINQLYILSGVAIFILIMAGINFTNLTTSTAFQKSKEIGIRKVNGGNKSDLIIQILGDAVIVSLIALFIALILIPTILIPFNEMVEKNFVLSDFLNLGFALLLLIITVLTGIIAGLYPAIFMSSFEPVRILKGEVTKGKSSANFRKVLVVVQFVASIVLITATLILSKQFDYIRFKDKCFSKENVVMLPLNSSKIRKQVEPLKTTLMKEDGVLSASVSSRMMGKVFSGWTFTNEKGEDNDCVVMFADENYVQTLDLKIKEGRSLSLDFPADVKEACMINETAAKILGYDDPIGRYLTVGQRKCKIVGLMNDFNFKSLHNKIEPLVIKYYEAEYGFTTQFVNIKLSGDDTRATLDKVKSIYAKFAPEVEFNPVFLDEFVNSLYKDETKLSKVINVFSILAIIIGCLGLFGLSAYAAQKRKKEIGIRKVLGSNEVEIVKILIKEFAVLVLVSIIIALPISYYIGEKYLESFIFRTEISVDLFVYSGLIAFVIAILTVGFHALKAAFSNPIESIKYE